MQSPEESKTWHLSRGHTGVNWGRRTWVLQSSPQIRKCHRVNHHLLLSCSPFQGLLATFCMQLMHFITVKPPSCPQTGIGHGLRVLISTLGVLPGTVFCLPAPSSLELNIMGTEPTNSWQRQPVSPPYSLAVHHSWGPGLPAALGSLGGQDSKTS